MPGVCPIDRVIALCLPALAVWILISGLDDLFLDLLCFTNWIRRRRGRETPVAPPPEGAPEKQIAILIPLWHEHRVIGPMLEHNLAAIRYEKYAVFAGGYPNDEPTLDALRELEARFTNVHLAICPHDGPTSKADCLNWIYQRMLLYEQEHATRFEVVAVHDAEDLIHPEELRWINHYSGRFGMVQIPVLPLGTPLHRFTHGVYCDEFAEFQTRICPRVDCSARSFRRTASARDTHVRHWNCWPRRTRTAFSTLRPRRRTTRTGSACTSSAARRCSFRSGSWAASR